MSIYKLDLTIEMDFTNFVIELRHLQERVQNYRRVYKIATVKTQ